VPAPSSASATISLGVIPSRVLGVLRCAGPQVWLYSQPPKLSVISGVSL